MNPFSRFLSQFLKGERSIGTFIEHWDLLEAMVVRLYKQKTVSSNDREHFGQSWPWLLENYPQWQGELAPYWPETIVGGQPAPTDPFLRLIEVDRPEAFFNDWEALQYLPAAREALNHYLVAQGADDNNG